jgi:hypothetical protein
VRRGCGCCPWGWETCGGGRPIRDYSCKSRSGTIADKPLYSRLLPNRRRRPPALTPRSQSGRSTARRLHRAGEARRRRSGWIFSTRMLGLFMVLPVFALYAHDLEGATPLLVGTGDRGLWPDAGAVSDPAGSAVGSDRAQAGHLRWAGALCHRQRRGGTRRRDRAGHPRARTPRQRGHRGGDHRAHRGSHPRCGAHPGHGGDRYQRRPVVCRGTGRRAALGPLARVSRGSSG